MVLGWGAPKGLRNLGTSSQADTVVIPAHGPIINGTDILRMRAMYTNLHLDLSEQLNLGMGPKDVVNMGLLDDYINDFGDPSLFLQKTHIGAYNALSCRIDLGNKILQTYKSTNFPVTIMTP